MEVKWVEKKNEGNGEEDLEGDEDGGPESSQDREFTSVSHGRRGPGLQRGDGEHWTWIRRRSTVDST